MNYDINKATGVTTEGFEILCILDYFVYAITFRNRKYRLYSAIVHLMYILFCRKKILGIERLTVKRTSVHIS